MYTIDDIDDYERDYPCSNCGQLDTLVDGLCTECERICQGPATDDV